MANPIETALEASSKVTISAASKLTGMSEQQVAEILAEGLPKALEAVKADPAAAADLVTRALESLPAPVQQAYEKVAATAAEQGATAEDLVAFFGSSAAALAETATSMGDATKEQVDSVLGAAVPAVKDAVRAGMGAADEAVSTIDGGRAQELLSQAQEAASKVFGSLARH